MARQATVRVTSVVRRGHAPHKRRSVWGEVVIVRVLGYLSHSSFKAAPNLFAERLDQQWRPMTCTGHHRSCPKGQFVAGEMSTAARAGRRLSSG